MKKGEIRRQAIIDTAEMLFYAKGYEGASVQDILDELNMSKGGFYHYFDSKLSLLEAICDQRAEASYQAALEAVRRCPGDAAQKLNAMFDKNGIWQGDSADYLSLLIRVTYRPDGALLREKMKRVSYERSIGLFNDIIHEGIATGVFFTPYPDAIGELVMQLGMGLTDDIAMILNKSNEAPDDMMRILMKLEVYRHAIERLLGAPYGSIVIYEMERMAMICRAIMEQNRRMAWDTWSAVEAR